MRAPNLITVRMRPDQLRALAVSLVAIADDQRAEGGLTISGTHMTTRGVTPDVRVRINFRRKS